jgi:hypothetical protein
MQHENAIRHRLDTEQVGFGGELLAQLFLRPDGRLARFGFPLRERYARGAHGRIRRHSDDGLHFGVNRHVAPVADDLPFADLRQIWPLLRIFGAVRA